MRILIVALLLIISACSSKKKMRGREAVSLSKIQIENLKITVEPIRPLSIEGYRLAKVYFRNLNENWLRVKSIDVVEIEGAPSFQVMLGDDLKAWRKSMALDFDLKAEDAKSKEEKAKVLKYKALLSEYKSEDHLYVPFGMPSMLQTPKWVLVQIPKNESMKSLKFKIVFIDSTTQIYRVRVKP